MLATLADSTGWFGGVSGMAFGLILGSFTGMASYRWPRSENWYAPSHCPHCNHKLGIAQLVPVASWLWQRGKAACCGAPISARYPLAELATALPTAVMGWHFGIGPAFILLAILICTLVLLSTIDFETGYIPDGSSLTIAATGLCWLYLSPPYFWWEPALSIGQCLLVGVGLAWGYSRLRGRDMMGWGDVKLMAASGFWLPPDKIPAYLLISGLLGTLSGWWWQRSGRGEEFPFGPMLAFTLLALISYQAFAS